MAAAPKRLNLITGPSGAGKTVFCRKQPDWDHCVLNLDDTARARADRQGRMSRREAWESLLAAAARRMAEAQPVLCIDTVFGAGEFTDAQALAEAHGYETALWVFSPAGPDVCRERIIERKSAGGHGRPELAKELYESALCAASEFSLHADYTFLIDTSADLKLAAWMEGFHTREAFPGAPGWAGEYFPIYADETPGRTPAGDLQRVAPRP